MHFLEFHHLLKRADEKIRKEVNSYPYPNVLPALHFLEEAERIQNEAGTTIEDLRPRIRRLSTFFATPPNERVQSQFRCYLFQTQHYNADFNSSERERFGYPIPFYQIKSAGYFRSDMQQALEPWKKSQKSFPNRKVLVTTCASLKILKRIAPHLPIVDAEAKSFPETDFVFWKAVPGSDTVLIWGAKKNKRGALETDSLKEKYLNIFIQLGAIPDRLEVNRLLGAVCEFKPFPSFPLCLQVIKCSWKQKIDEMRALLLDDSSGVRLYRKALIRWQDSFFGRYHLEAFAAPLLDVQVAPWMESGLVELSKAYQNCCEVVYFCIEAFPERFQEFKLADSVLDSLEMRRGQASVGLFPYAMTAFSHIILHILENTTCRSVACVSQGYFETLEALNVFKDFKIETQESLENLKEVPDILIVDIHPNNAGRDLLYQNNVKKWVVTHFEQGRGPLILVLDVTMNFFKDEDLQKTLCGLSPFLRDGRLKLCLLMSAAKLIQLGADNFSGGIVVSCGEDSIQFPEENSPKSRFFSFLLSEFSPLIGDYFQLTRNRANQIYSRLNYILSTDCLGYQLSPFDGEMYKSPVMQITLNGDEKVSYLSINFSPLFKTIPALEKDTIEKFHKLLLEVAALRNLPLTRRESFGFPISGLTVVSDKFRLSVGVETNEQLEDYVSLFHDFNIALSAYVRKCMASYSTEAFVEHFRTASEFACGKRREISLPFFEESHSLGASFSRGLMVAGQFACEEGEEISQPSFEERNPLTLHFQEGGWLLLADNAIPILTNLSDRVLFFFIYSLRPETLSVLRCPYNQYAIRGFFERWPLFTRTLDALSLEPTFQYFPLTNFTYTCPEGIFHEEELFVHSEERGGQLFRVSRLSSDDLSRINQGRVTYYMSRPDS